MISVHVHVLIGSQVNQVLWTQGHWMRKEADWAGGWRAGADNARLVGGWRAGSEEGGYEITRDFVVAMLEHFKAQKTIHRRFAFQIILQARTRPAPCYTPLAWWQHGCTLHML